jgi:hypothetical protein
MREYILLMYTVDSDPMNSVLWTEYLDTLSKIGALRDFGAFEGVETIGKDGPSATCYDSIVGTYAFKLGASRKPDIYSPAIPFLNAAALYRSERSPHRSERPCIHS